MPDQLQIIDRENQKEQNLNKIENMPDWQWIDKDKSIQIVEITIGII